MSNSKNAKKLPASNPLYRIFKSLSNAIDKTKKIKKNKIEQEKTKSKNNIKKNVILKPKTMI